jgi:hypothetical protein
MMNRLMITAATAALIAGTGFANAQGTGMGREGPSAGSAAQQSQGAAPSTERGSSAAPANRDATESTGPSGMKKSTQSEEKMQPQSGKNQRAQQDMKSGPRDEKSAQDNNMKENNTTGDKSKSMSSQNDKGAAGKDMKAEGREGQNGDVKAEGRNGNMNAQTKGTADSKATTTTGQAGAGAKLSSEQRTKITSVIRNQRVESLNNVDFNISIGTRVPRERVHLYPLPEEVVVIYPEWRGYEFIRVRDQILVVDPRTLEIVDVIQA